MMGRTVEYIPDGPCGNTVGLGSGMFFICSHSVIYQRKLFLENWYLCS